MRRESDKSWPLWQYSSMGKEYGLYLIIWSGTLLVCKSKSHLLTTYCTSASFQSMNKYLYKVSEKICDQWIGGNLGLSFFLTWFRWPRPWLPGKCSFHLRGSRFLQCWKSAPEGYSPDGRRRAWCCSLRLKTNNFYECTNCICSVGIKILGWFMVAQLCLCSPGLGL